MKKIIFIIAISFVSLLTNAQSNNNKGALLEAKLNFIKEKTKMSQEKFEKFKPLYTSYAKEMRQLKQQKKNTPKIKNIQTDTLSEKNATIILNQQVELMNKIKATKEKYFAQFRTILTDKEMILMLQAEAEIRKKIKQEIQNR